MIIERYGIKLIRLNKEDIELVRQKRNDPEISKRMYHREIITPIQQKKWFESVNNKLNYYFIICFQDKKIGLINAKEVNLVEGVGEGGIFLWDKDYWNNYVPTLASLVLLEFCFLSLNIFDLSFIRIRKDNLNAVSYNKALGYILIPGQENNDNQIYVLTKRKFIMHAAKLMKGAEILTGVKGQLKLSGQKSNINIEEINSLLSN